MRNDEKGFRNVDVLRNDEKDVQNVVLLRNYGVDEDEDVQNTSIMQNGMLKMYQLKLLGLYHEWLKSGMK